MEGRREEQLSSSLHVATAASLTVTVRHPVRLSWLLLSFSLSPTSSLCPTTASHSLILFIMVSRTLLNSLHSLKAWV